MRTEQCLVAKSDGLWRWGRPLRRSVRRRQVTAEVSPGQQSVDQIVPQSSGEGSQSLSTNGAGSDVQSGPGAIRVAGREVDILADPAYASIVQALPEVERRRRKLKPAHFGVETGEQWNHFRAVLFLADNDLLASYETLLSSLAIRSTAAVARYFYYAIRLREWCKEHLGSAPLDVIEIKPTAAYLAAFMAKLVPIRNYTTVDAADALARDAHDLTTLVPEANPTFNERLDAKRVPVGGAPTFQFIASDRLDLLPTAHYDLAVNINSLMNMQPIDRDRSIKTVYRRVREGGMYVFVNARKSLRTAEGKRFDNNPLLYPYRSADRIIAWEPDPFEQAVHAGFNQTVRLSTMLRVALLKAPKGKPSNPHEHATNEPPRD
jgi:hypothetical protein